MSYTLGTAAKATGKSKSTIQRAIKSGRMSATPLEDGSYRIDPAELARVFPVVSSYSPAQPEAEQYATANDTDGLRGQVHVLRELIQQIEGERDDLRRRLDAEAEAREKSADDVRRLTLILTHQPSTDTQPAPATEASLMVRPSVWFSARPAVWLAIVAAIITAAATWGIWLPYWTGRN